MGGSSWLPAVFYKAAGDTVMPMHMPLGFVPFLLLRYRACSPAVLTCPKPVPPCETAPNPSVIPLLSYQLARTVGLLVEHNAAGKSAASGCNPVLRTSADRESERQRYGFRV